MKKNQIRKSVAALAMAVVVGVSLLGYGCGSKSASTAGGVSGDFTGTAKGMGGDVTVTLTLEDGKITGCTAEGKDETPGIGTLALEQLPAQIAETGSIAVDGVSTATITSNAIKEAAAAALTAAGLNADDYKIEVKADETKAEDSTVDADVVIVGAGGAGMTAAITAAAEGKSVVILESQPMVGGNSVRATGGNNATRYLGISGYCTSPNLTIKHLQLPTDPAQDRLLISVHYYDPATFALEDKFTEWGHTGTPSKKENWGDEEHLEKIFVALRTAYVEKGIPVYIGEMGCVHRNNNRSEAFRKYYLEYVCKAARTNGMAVFYWDNGNAGAGRECSGLMNHATGTYVNNGKDVIDVMTKGYFSNDPSYTLESLYNNAPQ